MSKELVISSNPIETTVAILEDDRLVEIHVERPENKAIVGNIYKGRVTRVLPGMQSAFVDIGLERDAFLYVSDVTPADAPEAEIADDGSPLPGSPEPGAPEDEAASADPDRSEEVQGRDSDEYSSDDSRPRSRSRRRRRGRRADSDQDAGPAEDDAPAAETADSERRDARRGPKLGLLPGESLSKFSGARDASGPEQGTGDAEGSEPAADSEAAPDVAPDELGEPAEGFGPGAVFEPEEPASDVEPGEDSGPEAESAPEESDDRGDRAAGPGQPVARGVAWEGSETGEQDDDGSVEPPQDSAKLDPPSTLAEFWNPLKWLQKDSGDARKKGAGERGRTGGSRRRRSARPSGERRRGEGGPRSESRTSRSRSGRRQPSSRRSQRSQSRQSPRPDRQRSRDSRQAAQPAPQANIADLLQEGQEVIVQATKEPVGTKGARITCHVSLPGHYMVFMTNAEHSGVTKQIQSESERRRLRKLADEHSEGKDGRFVVRTSSSGVDDGQLVADMEHLRSQWGEVCEKAGQVKAPAMVHSDLDVGERLVREHLSDEYKAVWVDSKPEHDRIADFVRRFQPKLVDRVKHYTKKQPIHDAFGITKELERALKPKVWLKCGGYLVIDQTEALVAIDVNTGRNTGKSDRLEDTVLKTNLEAAEEIARQLRLRDLGGIIVIDFIDMDDRKNRQQVHQVLQEAMRKMRSPARVLPFNDFGLVVITRKSARQSLERAMCMQCPACKGSGTVKSAETLLSEIFSAASRRPQADGSGDGSADKGLTLRVHPQVAKSLKSKSRELEELEDLLDSEVIVRSDGSMPPEKFKLH